MLGCSINLDVLGGSSASTSKAAPAIFPNSKPSSKSFSFINPPREADYISIHAPLTKETRGMIDMAAISTMKDGVRLISASRGGLINENDLLEGLELGKIAGAALDVFEEEPPSTSKLIGHPNIIVTPHIGAQTAEAQARAGIDVAGEVIAALKGETLRWKIC